MSQSLQNDFQHVPSIADFISWKDYSCQRLNKMSETFLREYYVDMIASHSWSRFVSCTTITRMSCSNTITAMFLLDLDLVTAMAFL